MITCDLISFCGDGKKIIFLYAMQRNSNMKKFFVKDKHTKKKRNHVVINCIPHLAAI